MDKALGLKDRVQFYVAQPNDGRRFVKVDASSNQSAQVAPMLRRPLVQAFDRAGARRSLLDSRHWLEAVSSERKPIAVGGPGRGDGH